MRAQDERLRSQHATDPRAAAAHADMADRYEEMATRFEAKSKLRVVGWARHGEDCPPMSSSNIIERAFELAPQCGSLADLKRELVREGYFHVEGH